MRSAEAKAAIDHAITERRERTRLTSDRVLEELYYLATSNVDDYVLDALDEDEPVKPRPGRPIEVMRAVSSVKRIVGRDGDSRVELTLWNKPRALELAAKHLGMFGPDRIELDATPRMSLAFARAVVELGEQYRVQAGISPLNSGEVRRMVLGADATPDDAEPDASEPS